MKKNKLKIILAALIIGGFIFAVPSIISFAVGSSTTKSVTKPATNGTTTQSPNTQGVNRQFGGRAQFNTKPVLDKLVKAKTITAAQETKIIAYEKKLAAARLVEMQKQQKMTDAERQAARDKQQKTTPNQRFGQNQNTYADLVKNKTITQKQADAITKAIAAARPAMGNRQGNGNAGNNGASN